MSEYPAEPSPSPALDQRLRALALETMLADVFDNGHAVVHGSKLRRLTGVGNHSAKLYREILDAWEALGHPRKSLSIYRTPWQGHFVLLSGGQEAPQFVVKDGELVREQPK